MAGNWRSRAVTIGLMGGAAAFIAVMIAVRWHAGGHSALVLVAVDTIGLSFLAAGVAAWWRQPANVVGRLMVLVAVFWFAEVLQLVGSPVLFAVGYIVTYLPALVACHVALVYPEGRFHRPVERRFQVAVYATYLVLQTLRYLHEGVRSIGIPAGSHISAWATVIAVFGMVVGVVAGGWIVQRWRAATFTARRLYGPAWVCLVASAVLYDVAVVVGVWHLPSEVKVGVFVVYGVFLAGLPFAVLSGMVNARLARQRVAGLVLALRDVTDPNQLRDLISDTLGDPTLEVGYWSQRDTYVDPRGVPLSIPDGADRAVTVVDGRDHPLAVLVHDPTLAERQSLLAATVAAARMALENARLRAGADGTDTRALMAAAALGERRAIERDLHDGLQPRLLRLRWLAERSGAAAGSDQAAPLLEELAREARETSSTLRQLALRIHPPILTERGLAAAVEDHAHRSSVPILVELPVDRCVAAIEATAFFVILEAVTNAVKHASASQITVRGRYTDRRLIIDVTDDGVGGVDPDLGTGVRGMHDRVTAVGGTLAVVGPVGQGTRVTVDLPCG
jgi:signal transduction histidine kinase